MTAPPNFQRIGGLAMRRVLLECAMAIFIGLWIALFLYAVLRIDSILLGDYSTYWLGARHLLEGEPLYSSAQVQRDFLLGDSSFGRGYVYPPSAAILTAPIALVPLGLSWMLSATAMAILLGLATYLIARREGATRSLARVITVLIVTSPPAVEGLLTGNVNVLAAAGLGFIWVARGSVGLVSVGGALVKIYPLAGLAWAVRAGSTIILPIAIGFVVIAVSVVVLGSQSWLDFVATMSHGQSSSDFPLPSPRAAYEPLIGPLAASAATYGLAAVALFYVIGSNDDRRAFALLGLAMILPAPDWYLHYLIVPLVGVLPLVCSFSSQRRVELFRLARPMPVRLWVSRVEDSRI